MLIAPLLIGLLTTLSLQTQAIKTAGATIIDTGSTNRPGLRVTIDVNGHARVESRGLEPRTIRLDSHLSRSFLSALQSAAPLHALPAAHCMKSASFGSRLFIEYNGERSPDLSCPVQSDPRVDTLKKQALEILQAVKITSAPQNR